MILIDYRAVPKTPFSGLQGTGSPAGIIKGLPPLIPVEIELLELPYKQAEMNTPRS